MNGKNKIVGAEWVAAPQGKEFALDADGDEMYPMEILEQPQFPKEKMDFKVMYDEERYTNLYGAGTDSYDREKAHEKPSKLGFSIAKGYLNPDSTSNMFVCFMEWRPSKRDKVYQQTALACIYYGCDNLIEYSNLLIFEWYEKYNLQFLLRERPSWVYANVQNSKMDNRYGVDPATKSYWESDYAEYIENYCDNMWYHKQVHRALTYRKGKNDDLTCSNMLAWQNIKDKIHKNETARATNRSDSAVMDSSLFVTVHADESIIKDIF